MYDVDSYAIALVSILLPGVSGYKVLRSMKSDSRLFLIPVIMLSSSETEMTEECFIEGASDVLYPSFCRYNKLEIGLRWRFYERISSVL